MPFLSLSLANFRNLNNNTLDISAKEVFFVGENGQGKSNLLESLYFASYASSFRTHTDTEIATYGQKDFSVRTQFKDSDGKTSVVGVYFKDGKKKSSATAKLLKTEKSL